MDFLGDWDPAAARKPSPPKPAARPTRAEAAPPPAAKPKVPEPPPAAKAEPLSTPTATAPERPAVPAARPQPTRAAAVPRVQPRAPQASAPDLSDDRIRDLHGKLNELKKLNREEGQVSLDGLKKSLRAAQEKLREKHAGRRIDFDVVIKDGKAVVKPIVR